MIFVYYRLIVENVGVNILKTVAVIGGGITGLTTLYYLQKLKRERNLPLKLLLLEKHPHLGGKINTREAGEFIMETGADSIVARKENVMPLLEELYLTNDLVYNETGKSFIYSANELLPIPEDTMFGIPTSVESLFKSELISSKAKITALKDLITKNTTFTKDSSIGLFLKHFLGEELVEKQIAPILSGVYSGDLDKLTISSTLPYLLDYKNTYGSIIKGMGANEKKFKTAGNKKFISFKQGLSTIIHRLEEELSDVTILKDTPTTSIKQYDERYQITTPGQAHSADYVVLATPHTAAQHLLNDPELNEDFEQLKDSSLISVYIGYDVPDEYLPAEGTGFIASQSSNLIANACTWTSKKWAHTSKRGNLLVRLFYKSTSHHFDSLRTMSKEELLAVAQKDIKNSLGIKEQPIESDVTNWDKLMPTYHLKHGELVRSLTQKLHDKHPAITLAGCSYYGVGIAACITNGKQTAEAISQQLT